MSHFAESPTNHSIPCVLCCSCTARPSFVKLQRTFYECSSCDLLFVSAHQHLSMEEERRRYTLHRNDSTDEGYRAFLARIRDVVVPYLQPGMRGLDYGAGTSTAMAELCGEMGYPLDRYDPHFCPKELVRNAYDFVLCSEVVEHFRAPRDDFLKLREVVVPRGVIAMSTGFRDAHRGDTAWWYLRDPTHLNFYSAKAVRCVAELINAELLTLTDNVAVLRCM